MKIIPYQKKLMIFFGLVVLFLLTVVLFNYFEDAGNEFAHQHQFETKVTRALLNKQNVMICSDYNDRSLKRIMLEKLNIQPDVLVLGSSRAMPISQHFFKTSHFYNASVTGGSLEDDVAIYNIYSKRGWKPKTILISLDPWILDANNQQNLWKISFLQEYREAINLLLQRDIFSIDRYQEQWQGIVNKYSQLLSSNYFKASIKNMHLMCHVLKMPKGGVILNPKANDQQNYPFCNIQFPDGTRLPSVGEELVSAENADFIGVMSVRNTAHEMQINSDYMVLFEHFIKYLVAQHIHVVFYFPPYEPAAYQEMKKNPKFKMVGLVDKYFHDVALRYHFKVVGSYDPNQLNLHSDDFIDAMHLKRKGIDIIFEHQGFS